MDGTRQDGDDGGPRAGTGSPEGPDPTPPRRLPPWWERQPGRLERELAWLRFHGIAAEVDANYRGAGRIVLNITHRVEGRTLRLVARFPDDFPRRRFEVLASGFSLTGDGTPEVDGTVCPLGRPVLEWNMRDTVARFLVEQLPNVLACPHCRFLHLADAAG
jgi:hypothetical protein